jgi:hypothetical protein
MLASYSDAVVMACQEDARPHEQYVPASLVPVGRHTSTQNCKNPSNVRLSPLLAKSFLWFLNRWAPAYVYPVDYGGRQLRPILSLRNGPPGATGHILFSISLCMYQCLFFFFERQVQESAGCLYGWPNVIEQFDPGNGLVAPRFIRWYAFTVDSWNQAQCDRR